MVSAIRRKSRAYLYGPRNSTGTRRNCLCGPDGLIRTVYGEGMHSYNAYLARFCWNPLSEWILTARSAWFDVDGEFEVGIAKRTLTGKGAEKSCRTRRRKRGLRKGKRRSRVRHTRRSVPDRQPLPKAPNARKVNHIGRKYIWAQRSSSALAKECEKFNKFPRGPLPEGHPARRPRQSMKQHLSVKWLRLKDRATACGIPPTVAFHESFWKFLMMETSRGNLVAQRDLRDLLAGLPGNPDNDVPVGMGAVLARLRDDPRRKRPASGGGSRGAEKNPRGGRPLRRR